MEGKGTEKVPIETPVITLEAFLKWCGAVPTGGQAKLLIRGGEIAVNGETEKRRSRQLRPGDVVERRGGGSWCVVGARHDRG
ncbi:MAG TPA: RNA-binding S4 domain-containing protein [Firmicutes bacterium]|nr:RNA-binding S4 domain-containing protein [Bacillota bacterium]